MSILDIEGQIHGIEASAGPMPFVATADFPQLGQPAASEDITGGPGWAGLAAIERFVSNGGVLMTLGNGSTLALEAGLVRHVRRALETGIRTPGVELRTQFLQPAHPLAYGYQHTTSVFRADYPVYDLPRRWLQLAYCTSCLDGPVDQRWVVLQWGTDATGETASPVVSGGARFACRSRPYCYPRGSTCLEAAFPRFTNNCCRFDSPVHWCCR